jgi:hypothetical protein
MKNLIVAFVLFCFASAASAKLYCHPGWGGGDHGYDEFVEVVISNRPIISQRVRGEADPGYRFAKGSQSATLSMSVGWYNKNTYGSNVVLSYYPDKGTKASFAKANYAFAKACLKKDLTPASRKVIEKAALNPKVRK